MTEHNRLQLFNKLRTKRSLLWIGAAILCTLVIAATMMSSNAMARSGMQQTGNTNKTLAVITNSGSTNRPGYTLTINQDGSGSLVYQKDSNAERFNRFTDKTFPAGTFNSQQLSSLLTQIKDVSTIPDRGCMKSASFGTTTKITYQGKTSGDLSCLSNQDAQLFLNLKQLVQTMSTRISTSAASDIL